MERRGTVTYLVVLGVLLVTPTLARLFGEGGASVLLAIGLLSATGACDQADEIGEIGVRFRESLAYIAADRGLGAGRFGGRRRLEEFFRAPFVDFAASRRSDMRDVGECLLLVGRFGAV